MNAQPSSFPNFVRCRKVRENITYTDSDFKPPSSRAEASKHPCHGFSFFTGCAFDNVAGGGVEGQYGQTFCRRFFRALTTRYKTAPAAISPTITCWIHSSCHMVRKPPVRLADYAGRPSSDIPHGGVAPFVGRRFNGAL